MQNAIFIMLIAMTLIPAGDTAGKLLTAEYGAAPIFVSWSRFVVGALLLLPFIPAGWSHVYKDWRVWFRAFLLGFGITSIQIALSTESLANVFAAFFIGPLVSYVLATIFLNEPVTKLRSLLIAAGFGGVLIVVQPSVDMSTGMIWAVVAGTCYGIFLTLSRLLTQTMPPLALTFSQLVIPACALLPIGIQSIPPLTPTIVELTFASGLFSMGGNLLLLFAYRLTPATKMAPLVYFQLFAAVGLGWSVFGDLPDIWTWIGLAVIITTGVASARLR